MKKEVEFHWTLQCQESFDKVKDALTSPPILAYPDFNKEFILTTDASGFSISYILGQKGNDGKERVIYYGGRALRKEERNWSVTEREVLAILQGVEEYKVYLTGQKFTVITDHYAAQFLKKFKNETGRLGRWSLRLQAFDFEVKYTPGKQNGNADGLSRRTYDPEPETAETVGELPETFTITPDTDGVPSTNNETTPDRQERESLPLTQRYQV